MTRYRDKRTGRFVSRSTWKRSKAQKGKRYEKNTARRSTKTDDTRTSASASKARISTRRTSGGRNFRQRSEAARRGWETRRKNQKALEKQEAQRQAIFPQNREYFVVLLFRTRKNGKDVDRRLKEVIITAPDGASEDEIKKLYADWLKDNTKYTMQSIYNLVWAPNAGRWVEIRIIPRDEPTAEPTGTVKPNDARNPRRKSAKPKRKRRKAK